MFATHHKMDKLIALIDWNKQQLDGFTKDILDMGDITEKFKAFGWHAQTVDGHDPGRIKAAIVEAKNHKDAPSAIILDTIKGYGCNFAEGIASNHHMNFTKEEMDKAIDDASEKLEYVRELAKQK